MSLHFISDLGDQAVILPVLVVVGLVLLLAGWWRAAAAWFFVVPGTLGVVLFAKLSTMACQGLLPPIGLLSPSGHASASAVVYGGALALLLGGGRFRFGVAVASGLAAGTLVGYTRLALEVHTLADVIVGDLLGTMGVVVLIWLTGPRPRPRLRHGWISASAAVLAVVVLFHGRHVYAEMHIKRASQEIWPLTLCSRL